MTSWKDNWGSTIIEIYDEIGSGRLYSLHYEEQYFHYSRTITLCFDNGYVWWRKLCGASRNQTAAEGIEKDKG